MPTDRICIGVHAHAEPERLNATLTSLWANTGRSVNLLILGDSPDEETAAALESVRHMSQSSTATPQGVPACFNRLAAHAIASQAGVLVLFESGSLAGPRWLDHLIAAMAPAHIGLAGPSTNRSWNEQGAFPGSIGTGSEIARTAEEAARRFGASSRTLEPLYSLADFCYAVKREVVEAIGAADEGYGLGPCWEMDYNIRAARAGFLGVWVGASYVYRSPFTARRVREEAARFEESKRRYQDSFCALRLRGEKASYEPHCLGEACPHFAPKELIHLRHNLRPPAQDTATRKPKPEEPLTVPHLRPSSSARPTPHSDPQVTCIMPTYNRRPFIPQAVRSFFGQDYPDAELLVMDDGTDPVNDILPDHPRIRYLRLDRKHTIGSKRNIACREAKGEIIIHWDDDDWYPRWRIRAQVQALIEHSAGVCGTSRLLYFDPRAGNAWRYEYGRGGSPGGGRASWVAGNTLAYRRELWSANRFADTQIGEDNQFIASIVKTTQPLSYATSGERPAPSLYDLSDPTLCVAVVHQGNTSRKSLQGVHWTPHPLSHVRELLGDDLYFYRSAAGLAPPAASNLPLVSCIMPTYNRREFVPLALRSFALQDYPNKELIVVDDGPDAVRDLVHNVPGVRYIRLERRLSIGEKRNIACREAKGEIIAHWDDDDWYSPDRLRYQCAPILAGEAEITGLENRYMLELPALTFWTTRPQLHRRMFVGDVHGGTLVFSKRLLSSGLRYPDTNLAEDAALLSAAMKAGKRLARLSNPGLFVYVRHGSNAWTFKPGHFLDPSGWEHCAPPALFSAPLLASYRQAGQSDMSGLSVTPR